MTTNPALYQINTRVWLRDWSERSGGSASLDDFPDAELDRLQSQGFDWLYFLSVWQTGEAGRAISRSNEIWLAEFRASLPDLSEADISGSGFAITAYSLDSRMGNKASLARLRERIHLRGMKLMLDFVPNHTAQDHPWVTERPEFYLAGTEEQLARQPQNYKQFLTGSGPRILAYGRDPYFDGWPDTLQLNYSNSSVQEAMIAELENIAAVCDGVRCDMAMLVLPEVFEKTWGTRMDPFWPGAIAAVRKQHPEFAFMAEVYWDLEWQLQQQGFDYTYDKRLYDRLRQGPARPVREHLLAEADYQRHLARFLENHDEPRASAAFLPEQQQAAAVITFTCPGLRFFHQGQLDGYRKRISVHLNRRPPEQPNEEIQAFYKRLLASLKRPVVRAGQWHRLEVAAAWDGNWTWDCFVACLWQLGSDSCLMTAVNYSDHQSQCRVRLPLPQLSGKQIRLTDLFSSASYRRDGDLLVGDGLFLDMPAWGYHLFTVEAEADASTILPQQLEGAGIG